MALNVTLGAVMLLVATVPEILAVVISLKRYLDRGYREYLFMFVTWVFLWLGNLLIGISYLTLDLFVYRLGIAASAPLLFGLMVLVDSVSRDHVDPRKVFVVTAASTVLGLFAFDETSVTLNISALGETGPSMVGGLAISGAIVFVIAGIFWLYYMAVIHLRAPATLKRYSRVSLIGALLAGPGSMVAFATGFVWIVPGTDYLLIGLGALLTAYAFASQPKLGYVLPFEVFRLVAFDTESGIPIFAYTWNEQGLVDSTLFTGAMTGINNLLNESLSRGAVEYIAFEHGVLLIDHFPEVEVAFSLLASRSSAMLHQALRLFAEAFVEKFDAQLRRDKSITSAFTAAEEIVDTAFPFVVAHS
ncbi:MAG: hypothetical protein ACTSPE_09935 [Candidatus Thorarchaeota archaeon]